MTFDDAFKILISHEGGYSKYRADPGGETMYGITVAVARRNGYHGIMRELTLDFAQSIYRRQYWDAVQADALPLAVRYAVFDAAVNSGVAQSVRWLQRAAGVTDDAVIGPSTLFAVHAADPLELVKRVIGQRLMAMINMSGWQVFSRGWAKRIASLLVS